MELYQKITKKKYRFLQISCCISDNMYDLDDPLYLLTQGLTSRSSAQTPGASVIMINKSGV